MAGRDLRYMKSGRGAGTNWFFVYRIPRELLGHPRFMTRKRKPMDKIVESLGTDDPGEACRRRDDKVVYWNRQFRMLRDGPSEDDIREEAIEVYRAALKAWAARPAGWDPAQLRLHLNARDYARRLDEAIRTQVAKEITDYCERSGGLLEAGTEPYRKFGIELIRMKMAAGDGEAWLPWPDGRTSYGSEAHLPSLPKIEPPEIESPVASSEYSSPLPAPPLTRRETETLSEAFNSYVQTELDGTSAGTVVEYQFKVNTFIQKVGDLPLSKVTDHVAVDFLDKHLLSERKLKPKTRNGYAMLFSAIFKSAIRRKKATYNPFADQLVKAESVHYEPFTDQEIATLFADAKFEISPAKYKTATALPWVSLVSAFTGCRLEEVAQLKASDIKKTEGIWHFEFCHEGNGKTKAATRKVPLHHVLIDAGLLRYRDKLPSGSPLFPGLKEGRQSKLGSNLGDMFRYWRKKLGIVRPGVNFHSFRHTVGDRLRRAGIQESDIAALLGHEDERITSRVYGHNGPGLKRLREVVEQLTYKGLRQPRPSR
jgi:integrase